LNSFLLALRFLTVIPLGSHGEVGEGDIKASVAYFPVVGLVQGLILVIVYYVFRGVFGGLLLSALVASVLALTNGGFHLDGFMDTIDGLAGGHDRDSRLEIMRDSHAGAVGVVFTVFLIIIKVTALSSISAGAMGAAVFLLPVGGRWSTVPLAVLSGYARPGGGLGKAVTGAGARELAVATAITLALMFYFTGLWVFIILVGLGGAACLISMFFRSRLGGVTGDVFGFQAEVSEVLFLLLFTALIG